MPATLKQCVTEFRRRFGKALYKPDTVRDQCIEVSDEFYELLIRAGHDADVISGLKHEAHTIVCGHFAVLVGETVYDWTARQFNSRCPVPLVQPLSEWRKDWPVALRNVS